MPDRSKTPTTAIPLRQPVHGVETPEQIEYIASSTEYPYFSTDIALPKTIDEVEAKFGETFYQRMLDTEPILEGVIKAVKSAVLVNGVSVGPAVEKPDKDEQDPEVLAKFEDAQKAQRYIEKVLKDLAKRKMPFGGFLWSALDAVYMGHKLAEVTRCTIDSGEFKGKDGIASLKTKPRQNYTLVVSTVDYAFRGVSAKVPGGPGIIWVGIIGDASANPWIVSPEKVVLFSFDRRDGDPRGRSWFKPAYVAYRAKQMQRPERAKTAGQFGGGFVYAVAPEFEQGMKFTNPETKIEESAQEVTQWALRQLANGKAATFLNGTQVFVNQPSADPKFFSAETDAYDREMVVAIVSHARSMMEAQHGSKADSEEAGNRADNVVDFIRRNLEETVQQEIFYPLVRDSFGEEFADEFTPKLVLSPAKTADFSANATAGAAIGYSLDPSQFPWFEENILGIKRRDPSVMEAEEVAGEVPAGFPGLPGVVPGAAEPTGDQPGRGAPAGSGQKAVAQDGRGATIDARSLRQVDEGRSAKAARPQPKA